MPKLALLSNVNMNYVIRLLQKQAEVYEGEGYGNEIGLLMNPNSTYHAFSPEFTFVVMDLMELLEHDLEPDAAVGRISGWFADLERALEPEVVYYVSDAYLWGTELEAVSDSGRKHALEHIWQERLEALCKVCGNVHILPYRRMVEGMGEEAAFSRKMWYMGKILLGGEAQKRLCGMILDKVEIHGRTPKKVLLLDLDNTLWGGLAGENDHTPIQLSEEHGGLAYKNLQRVIRQMRMQGVLLAVVSKNNREDALEILEKHPHMVLGIDDFAAMRINWAPKYENIREIADELNLGTDSFVFWDDSPAERQMVKELLPEVAVPDFPDHPELSAPAMAEVYREYFAKPAVTEEDRNKTSLYAANARRKELEGAAAGFEEYLRGLETVAVRMDPRKHLDRMLQLMNKTNQFNLTTRRYSQGQAAGLLEDGNKRVYLYGVSDRFGDNGIVAAAVVDCLGIPVVEEFVMSCRVMGRNIEYALVEDIEADLREDGYGRLRGRYIPTAKNKPVAGLYERLGYKNIGAGDGVCGMDDMPGTVFEIELAHTPERMYYVRMERERFGGG